MRLEAPGMKLRYDLRCLSMEELTRNHHFRERNTVTERFIKLYVDSVGYKDLYDRVLHDNRGRLNPHQVEDQIAVVSVALSSSTHLKVASIYKQEGSG